MTVLHIHTYTYTIVGQFPDRTLSRGQIPDWHFPDGHFPDEHFPERTFPRPDTSPTRHFPTKTFPRTDIFPTITIFKFLHFLAKLFVKANGLDFPLIFSF